MHRVGGRREVARSSMPPLGTSPQLAPSPPLASSPQLAPSSLWTQRCCPSPFPGGSLRVVCRSGATSHFGSRSAEGLGWVIQASPRRAGVLREDERDQGRHIRYGDSGIDSGARPIGEEGGESSKGRHRCSPQSGAPCDVAHQRGGAGEDLRARKPDDRANSKLGCPRGGILLPHSAREVGTVQRSGVRYSSICSEFESLVDSFCVGSMEIPTSREGVLTHGAACERMRPPSPSLLLRSPTRGAGRRTPPARDSCERGPVGREGGIGKLGHKEKTHSQNPPTWWAAREDKYNTTRVRCHRRDFSDLVWVRRDLFQSGEFSVDDFHPVGRSDWLPVPKIFKFSRDF